MEQCDAFPMRHININSQLCLTLHPPGLIRLAHEYRERKEKRLTFLKPPLPPPPSLVTNNKKHGLKGLKWLQFKSISFCWWWNHPLTSPPLHWQMSIFFFWNLPLSRPLALISSNQILFLFSLIISHNTQYIVPLKTFLHR